MSQLTPQPSRQPLPQQTSTLRRLRRLGYWLDDSLRIPGTPYRIGLDPLLDLLPVGGDFLGSAFSIYIVIEAARMGLPRSALVQMVWNIFLDTAIGAVPVLGTVVDATWKANTKNIQLVEEHLDVSPEPKQQANWLFLTLLLGGLLLSIVIVAAISVIILRWLLGAITN